MNIGKAIKLCRTQKNMKQAGLANLAGISVSYLSLLEQGKRDPNISTVQNIAKALNIPFSLLIFLAAEKDDIEGINPELAEKLSHTALQLMKAAQNESAKI
jgi:transcriptional regulator with XRE-family HTH domain